MDDYSHVCLGFCRYASFTPGQLVEISPEGYEQGIHELNTECFGYVKSFNKGILEVVLLGTDSAKEFHPCYWTISTITSLDNWQKEKHLLDREYTV